MTCEVIGQTQENLAKVTGLEEPRRAQAEKASDPSSSMNPLLIYQHLMIRNWDIHWR